jgi:hypothetical protein
MTDSEKNFVRARTLIQIAYSEVIAVGTKHIFKCVLQKGSGFVLDSNCVEAMINPVKNGMAKAGKESSIKVEHLLPNENTRMEFRRELMKWTTLVFADFNTAMKSHNFGTVGDSTMASEINRSFGINVMHGPSMIQFRHLMEIIQPVEHPTSTLPAAQIPGEGNSDNSGLLDGNEHDSDLHKDDNVHRTTDTSEQPGSVSTNHRSDGHSQVPPKKKDGLMIMYLVIFMMLAMAYVLFSK